MKNIFRYPLVISVLAIAIIAEAYYIVRDYSQVNNKTMAEIRLEQDEAEVIDEFVLDETNDSTEEIQTDNGELEETVIEPEPEIIEPEPITGDPYVIDSVYADTLKEGIFDGVLYNTVDASYFDDAVFIGDSRMEGLHDYGGLDNADFYYLTGLSVYNIYDKKLKNNNGAKESLEDALKKHQYKKVYLMLGVNELGTGTDEMFAEHYKTLIDKIHELEPEAIIYVHGILWVSQSKSSTDKYINNPHINSRNLALQNIIDNDTSYYLEINSVFGDGNGNLQSQYTGDNVHLYAKYYYMWTDYLLGHAIAGR